MTTSSPLNMAAPFPVMFSAPIAVPDWVGDAAVRAGNAVMHPRRVWVWDSQRYPTAPYRDPHSQHGGPTTIRNVQPPVARDRLQPAPVHTVNRSASFMSGPTISERSSQPAFSIIERTHYSDASSLPGRPGDRQGSTNRSRMSPPSAWGSDFLSVPSPSLQTPATPTFPTALPVPPPRDPLLGSIITMRPRTSDPKSISEPRPLSNPDAADLLGPPEFDDFCPPLSSTPRRPAAASAQPSSTPRKRGLSMASLSLRRRPQETAPRPSASLGRRSGQDVSFSLSKRGFGSLRAGSGSTMNRSFSSKSFFSTRTFGTAADPETSFQKTCTDIDLIACMARNLVESASPIRQYDEDVDTVDYDHSHSHSYSYSYYYDRSHRYYERGPSDDFESSEDEVSYDDSGVELSASRLAKMDLTDIEDRIVTRALKARSKRHSKHRHSQQRHARRAEVHNAAYAQESPSAVPDRLDRALQDCFTQDIARTSAVVTPDRPSHRSQRSRRSSMSGDGVPNWLVSAIRVSSSANSTPRQSHSESFPVPSETLEDSHLEGEGPEEHSVDDEREAAIWTGEDTCTDDESDKENYLAVEAQNYKRASTSAFGPRTPSPTVTFPSSAPTSPKRAPLRTEASRPAALRASWGV